MGDALTIPLVGSRPRSLRLMRLAGWLLVASGVLHVGVWCYLGGPWEGDVSWRKPILFGISAGSTVLSIAWVCSKMKPRWGDSVWFSAFGLAMVVEVALITLQQWRGVPSHFNRATTIDGSVLLGIEALIIFATLVIFDVTWRSFRNLDAEADIRFAIRSGMVYLVIGCLLGFVAVAHGNAQQSVGAAPGIYGKAGLTKFAHGMPIHAIQFLPAVVWGLKNMRVGFWERRRAVLWTSLAIGMLCLFSCLQTFSGRGRFDLTTVSGLILLFASVFFLIGVVPCVLPRGVRKSAVPT